jgi:dsRNA-specific ribonuclease
MTKSLEALAKKIGYQFSNLTLLETAMRHQTSDLNFWATR